MSQTPRHDPTAGGPREHATRADPSPRAGLWPWAASAAVLLLAASMLRWQGRLWACACGRLLFWTGEAWSGETSQHLFDPYAFTHVLHGVVFCGLLALAAPGLSWSWRFLLAVSAEAVWEVAENTRFVIDRYREATAALGYTGDTVVNSLGDIVACALGFAAASRLGLARSALFFAAVEAVLLITIRDSLLLNVIMLVYPVEGIREWQAGR